VNLSDVWVVSGNRSFPKIDTKSIILRYNTSNSNFCDLLVFNNNRICRYKNGMPSIDSFFIQHQRIWYTMGSVSSISLKPQNMSQHGKTKNYLYKKTITVWSVNVPPDVPYVPGRRRGLDSSSVSESESERCSPRAITRLLQTGHTRRFRVSHGSMHLVW
jgi:hypothetical protein